jgi:threonine/homoserine/homoserine lactone efflux protein
MIDPAKFALFVVVSWALIITPGPDMLYVLTRGMAHGRKAGIVSAIGVICGILIHTLAAAFGVTLIFQTSPFAFLIMKYLGMTYLIYLGIKAWMDKSAFNLSTSIAGAKSHSLFYQGVMSNVLNPKIAIFFLAFLPQFVNHGSDHIPLQMIILGLTFALFGLCFLVAVGYFAGAFGAWLTRLPQLSNILRWLTGGVLLSLGLRLALTEQK